MHELFGTTYFTMCTPIIVLFFVVPVSGLTIFWITGIINRILSRQTGRLKRLGISAALTTLLSMALAVVMFWDVYQTGQQVKQLCNEQGGLHIYRTVKTEGFLGSGFKQWLEYGFSYIEYAEFRKKYRLTMVNGKATKEEVDSFISQYEVGHERVVLNNYIAKEREYVKDRQSDEVIGELVYFKIYPGWVDKGFLGSTGLTFIPWICGDKIKKNGRIKTLYSTDLTKAVLIPKYNQGKEK